MENFLIYTNEIKDPEHKVQDRLCCILEEYGKKWFIAEQNEDFSIRMEKFPENIDCVIVIGGDGSFITAARAIWKLEIPILGINLGTVGYLTEVEVSDLKSVIRRVVYGDFYIEERMMLKAECSSGKVEYALNDVVLNRKGGLRVAHFSLYVNDELLTTYEADGIIISTPTGSTAYNRSAGGPIVKPSASLIVVTPICPQDTSVRSLVFDGNDIIKVVVGRGRRGETDRMNINLDGSTVVPAETDDWVKIHRTRVGTKIVKLYNVSFIETLRTKLKGK